MKHHKALGSVGRLTGLLLALLLLAGCAAKSLPDPLKALSRELDPYPEYSVILDDMEISGNFFKTYYHKYKVLFADKAAEGDNDFTDFQTRERGWVEVDKSFFEKHENALGMALLTKTAGEAPSRTAQPPGYQYVGNERYGQWQSRPNGTSFWVFYGQYSLLRNLLGTSTHPIRRSHWDDYRGARSSGRPYYGSGSKPVYGTSGQLTKTRHPTFYERQSLRQSTKNQKFSQKVKSRTGRTQSRGSGRFGGK